ncbi:CpsD/CapB family tyrosine-protein kinase [Clostridium sp.]|uniref:CpsD/CapB family tyrosine-protein kinase n=1 Tax=Clostridium sp. TaxID=1506 RepID=UPI003217ABC8
MLIAKAMPNSISAEAYRMLRTKIKYSSIDKQVKTIVVTAAEAAEGKSTVAGNLAVTLSQSGSRVVLIDCDLRRPSLHRKFNVSNVKGLTDYLIEKFELKDVVNIVGNNLHLITAGGIPPNPAEVIGSKRLESFIGMLGQSYDYIIIDTPPVMAVTDAQILAAKSDATLLVVRNSKTKGKSICRAYEELTKVGANVIGAVLNAIDNGRKDSYYYYYSEETKKKKKFGFRFRNKKRRS